MVLHEVFSVDYEVWFAGLWCVFGRAIVWCILARMTGSFSMRLVANSFASVRLELVCPVAVLLAFPLFEGLHPSWISFSWVCSPVFCLVVTLVHYGTFVCKVVY